MLYEIQLSRLVWLLICVLCIEEKHSKRNVTLDIMTLPFTSLPKNDSRGTVQQRILDLEVVILLYSYNPVQSCGTLETFTSLSKYRSSKSIFPLKFHPKYNLDRRSGIGTLYGDAWQYLTRPTSKEIPAEEYSLPLATRACSDCSPSGWVFARALQNSSQGRSRLSTWVPRNTNLFLVWE